jgi:hypothetical protein
MIQRLLGLAGGELTTVSQYVPVFNAGRRPGLLPAGVVERDVG